MTSTHLSKSKSKRSTEPKWTFTLPTKRRDIHGHLPTHESYNENTLLIPSSIYSTMSLGEKQYWDLKKMHMDKVLFFNIGPVYDLYEQDALVASREFGLEIKSSRNGGPNMFYCSISTKQITEWKRRFVERGYKIAIAHETNQKEDYTHGTIIKRVVSEIVTPGLRDYDLLQNEKANYLLALREDVHSHKVGVCFVDVSTGNMYLDVLDDDEQKTHVDMLIQQIVPSEIILPKKHYSKNLRKIIHALGKKDVVTEFTIDKEFLSVQDTERLLLEGSYFPQCNNYESWPPVLRHFISGVFSDPIAISALGAILYYLKTVDRDTQVFTTGRIDRYNIQNSVQFMLLDGHTLTNLEILNNSDDFSQRGSLLEHMDQCLTPSGKRLFSHWLAHPLRDVDKINERLDAIDDFNNLQIDEDLLEEMKSFGDIERHLQVIHTFSEEHKRKVNLRNSNSMSVIKKKAVTFYRALDSIQKMCKFVVNLQHIADESMNDGSPIKSALLNRTLLSSFQDESFSSTVHWNDLDFVATQLQASFTKENIESNDDLRLIPNKFDNHDTALSAMERFRTQLDEFIVSLQSTWGNAKIRHKDKDIVEVPESVAKTNTIPSDWVEKLTSRRMVHYSVPEVGKWENDLSEAIETYHATLSEIIFDLIGIFHDSNELWRECINRIATLDCLFSLWRHSNSPQYVRPEFVDSSYEEPRIHIVQGRHPVVELSIDNYVPNDTYIGGHHPHTLLVSGPNQGGKSCLLRQSAVIVIMAQIGSYVPAELCSLSAVDRVFTRIGANDRILKGESTFMVEMTETSNILKHATSNSLVILDELGRGTSTFDGQSIAYAVLRYLIEKTRSMTLFATHYHNLCREMEGDQRVKLVRMKFHEETDTPLFQLEPGISPSSYGLRVARMASIPAEIVQRAKEVSNVFKNTIDIPDHEQMNKEPLTEEEEVLFLKLALETKNMSNEDLMKLQKEACSSLYDLYLATE